MERDTQEWRRPWRDGDAARPTSAPGAPQAATPLDDGGPAPAGPAEEQQGRTVRRGQPSGRAPGIVLRPSGVVDGVDAPTTSGARDTVRARVERPSAPGVVVPSGPATPPDSWSDDDHGPGSPSGSVRPPDTTGTVDAPPRGGGRGRLALTLVASLVGAAIGTGVTLAVVDDGSTSVAPTRADQLVEQDPVRAPVVGELDGQDAGTDTVAARVARAVLPSVVRIEVYDELAGGERQQIGLGSGVVYRSDGFILTNNHVIDGAEAIEVQFADGVLAEAEVVGADRLTDLAVLTVDADDLPAVNLREDPLVVGETAIAIGSPFGLDASVTAGIVSALNRNLDVPAAGDQGGFVIPAVIQTDAAINPGNSGGALVDAQGRLIGINTAILTRSGGSQGVGFAIPVRSAVDAADQLITTGSVSHPFLGISGFDVTFEVAERFREEFGIDLEGGAVVAEVVPGSGAATAGVQPDDVIVAVGGEPVGSMGDVIVAIRGFQPGDTVEVEVLRQDERRTLTVTLGERPE